MEVAQKALIQLLTAWRGASRKRQAMVVVFAAVTALAVSAFAYLSSNGEYRQMYANLSSEDIDVITTRLSIMGIPHRVENGNTVLVPGERMVSVKVLLAKEGIPNKGGKGFELFDDSPLGMTPFTQNVNFTRALQSELARMIMQLEMVAAARVAINRAEPTPFVRDQRPSTASVILKLKNGTTLNRATAASIVGMVARAVDGLRPEYVSLVDSTGRTLSDAKPGDPDGEMGGQIEHRRELENYLARKAEDMLSRVLGPGRAVVRISADMSTQRVKEVRETYSPEDRAVSSEQTVVSKSTAPSPARGGAGSATNIVRTGSGGTGAGNGNGATQQETSETKYLVSKSVRELDDRMGGVQRLTVAAMIDLASAAESTNGRPALTKDEVQDIIKQAVGFRAGRDEIKVSDVALTGSIPLKDVEDDAAQIQKVALYVNLARNAALGVGFLTALATMWLLLRRRPTPAAAAAGTTAETQKKELDRFIELAERDPERLANLLESLIGEPAIA